MRVGIVTTWFERGAAYVSRQYRDLLRKNGSEVFIYARGGERYAQNDPNWDTPEVTWGKRGMVRTVTGIDRGDFVAWIRHNGIEIVIFNEQWWLPPVYWAMEYGCRTVAYIDYYTEDTVAHFSIYDGLICNTQRHYGVFKNHPHCLYIPWGTDLELFRPQSFTAKGHDGPIFFHSAGMSPYRKGTDLVLQAFSGLSGKAHLILHLQEGAFNSIADVASLAEQLVAQGRLTLIDKEVPAPGLYHMGDVYVYPSRLEGIGLTQAEALACGLPLIVPDNPPMNEFITPESGVAVSVDKLWARSDGYYWPQCLVSSDALVEAMQTFVDGYASLPEKKAAARAFAERHLNWFDNGGNLAAWLSALPRHDLSDDLKRCLQDDEIPLPPAVIKLLKKFPHVWTLTTSLHRALRKRILPKSIM
ncbi:MAG: glycosyltransferase family 4 protein [Desulfovibrio sp.]|uniref:glycosyltransferase family 4 protein n=1 Tax=Desulfovibrio sp. TaxID=885 RepID=UPI0039E2688A